MMMLLALPQPGPPPASSVAAWAALSFSNEPNDKPIIPAPPTRRISRRVGRKWASHKSLALGPTIRNMVLPSLVNQARQPDSHIRRPSAAGYLSGCTGTTDY